MSESGTKGTISKQFCALDSDITFQSCDGVLFKVHRRNLEVTAGGFPPSEFASPAVGEVVPLQENSDALELLFQYAYPQRQPDLTEVDFAILAQLAEAAEKYEVYSAMYSCRFHMRAALPNHPIEVLEYAAKHHYPDIADEAAPRTIGMSMKEIAAGLSPICITLWIQYYGIWLEVLRAACAYDLPRRHGYSSECAALQRRGDILCNLAAGPGSLRELEKVFQTDVKLQGNGCCEVLFLDWRQSVVARVSSIPKFSTFL